GGSTQGGGAVHGLEHGRHQAGGGGVAQERRRAHHAAAGRGQALPRRGRAGRDLGAVRQSPSQGRLRGVAGRRQKISAIASAAVLDSSCPGFPQIRSKLLASTTAVPLAPASTVRARDSSGVVGRGSLPSARRRSTTVGSLRMATTSAFKRSIIGAATRAGASKPCQPVTT